MPSAMGCVGMCIYLPYVHTHAEMHTMVFLSSRISWCYYLIVLYCKYPYSFLLVSWPGLGSGMEVSGQQFHSYLCCFFTSVAFSSLNWIPQLVELFGARSKKKMHTPTIQVPALQHMIRRPELLYSSTPSAMHAECSDQKTIYGQLMGNTKHGSACVWNPIPIPVVSIKTNSGRSWSSSREKQSVLWHSSSEQNERGTLHLMSPCILLPRWSS